MANIYLEDALKSININVNQDNAEFHLESMESVLIHDDGITWSKIPNMVLGRSNSGFSVSGGTLIKTNNDNNFLVNGVSDLEINKAATIFYGLAVNGNIISHEITEHTFSAASKIENISITASADLKLNDEVEIWVKGDGTLGVTVTVNKLDVTFWSE